MASFGCNLSKKEMNNTGSNQELQGLADTGAQSNSASMVLLEKLNFPVEKLLKTSHAIRGATNSDLDVVGAILSHLEWDGKRARCIINIFRKEGTQIFSQTTLRELGMIPENFAKLSYISNSRVTGCHCPTRTSPTSIPTVMQTLEQEGTGGMVQYT